MQADQSTLDEAKRALSQYRRSLKDKALRAYQEEWVRHRRELKILNRVKLAVTDMSGPEPAPKHPFTHTRTWASCQVDSFQCSLVARRDVAGDARFAVFMRSSFY